MRQRPVLFALLPYALLAWRFRFTCDDAFITFRYARHLAEGTGLHFNPGETPPVEGYSNFLWTALLALPHLAGLGVAHIANAVSALCGAAMVLAVARYCAGRLELCHAGTAATALFAGTLPAVAVWATSGLESMPFALAVFLVFALLTGSDRSSWGRAALAGAAAVLLRADGFGFVGLALGAAWIAGAAPKALIRTGALVALAVAGHFVWRHGYYGEWFPNTARVKAGLSSVRIERGAGYLASQVLAMPALLIVSLSGLVLLARRDKASSGVRAPRSAGLGALAFVLLNGVYAVFVGGDFMAMGRFLVPSMPFLAVVFAVVSTPWAGAPRLGFAGLLVGVNLLGCFDLLGVPDSARQAVHFRWNTDVARSEVEQWAEMKANGDELALMGRALAAVVEPGESMVRSSVGGVGYFTELWLFDRNGLVSPEVVDGSEPLERASPGHDRRVEPEFFFGQRPTYYGAKLVGGPFKKGGLGRGAQALVAAGKLEVSRTPLAAPLIEAAGMPQGIELQLLRLRWEQ